jgi:hypothetical protein
LEKEDGINLGNRADRKGHMGNVVMSKRIVDGEKN